MGRICRGILIAAGCFCAFARAHGQHQTADLTPLSPVNELPYRITVRPVDFGAASLPTLHSYAAGHYDGKWVLIAGRTNGLHGFDRNDPLGNFPAQAQNRDVWVIDPMAKASWSRSLADAAAGLSAAQLNSLTPTNTQYFQRDERLYVTGGYGVTGADDQGTPTFGTFDVLSAIDLPGLADWAMGGPGAAADHIRQISHPSVKVTGGAMYEMAGRAHLVFGQDFNGTYAPQGSGVYTQQVRSFAIVDDDAGLSIEDVTMSDPQFDYRRRDLNVFPVVAPGAVQLEEGLVALSGVFTFQQGAWTVPVEIDALGQPTMNDPEAPETFKQGFNGYHSAKLGLFSEAAGDMHEVLFGGISLQYVEETNGQLVTDNRLPFVNDITAVVIDAGGQYSQHHLGYYPVVNDLSGNRLRFGTNAEFFQADGIAAYENGVIKLDDLGGETTLGYIFGGIAANRPNTRNVPGTNSSASNVMFEVVYTPVPEPKAWVLFLVAVSWLFRALGKASAGNQFQTEG